MPICCLGTVPRNALAQYIHLAQDRLGRAVPLFRRLFIPLGGLLQIFGHPLARQ